MIRNCENCGKEFRTYPCYVKLGQGRFCTFRCYRLTATPSRRHGESRTPLHNLWHSMKSRCKNRANPLAARYYSDRNITVCPEWLASYEAFRDWALSHGYAAGLEIDRIDNDKGYSPDNCRWATRTQQMQNTRTRTGAKTSRYKGVSREAKAGRWRAQVAYGGRHHHVGMFETEEEAARAYDAVAREQFGEFAVLNFKD